MSYAILPHRTLLKITGDDTVPFLQGLVSNDVTKLAQQKIMYAALLSPQGKFLHDFFLIDNGDAILIDCEKARAEDLLKRLSLYKLRSKVTMELLPYIEVAAIWNDSLPHRGRAGVGALGNDIAPQYPPPDLPPAGGGTLLRDPRLPELGWRMIGENIPRENAAIFDNYEQLRLSLGVPDGSRDMIVDKTLLLECGFEALHGVDFNKGCYVGQEVTARSKFRAQLRKSLYKISGSEPLPPSGTPITAGETPIGELRSSSGKQGLAILRMEDVEKNPDNLRAAGMAIKASIPAWMS